ncbi:hypothetical protein [Clostridium perfringens]|uniref:hypothetical protein n=1 Tax=Clostridium perfringens TaxID=1502 RepID=UPI003CEACB95
MTYLPNLLICDVIYELNDCISSLVTKTHSATIINPIEKEDQIYNAKVILREFIQSDEKYSINADLTTTYSNNASCVSRRISLYKKQGH